MTAGRLRGLDGLRGVAAIGAMLFHAHVSFLPFAHGYLAVDLFFMLSGFVIARSYEPALTQDRGDPRIGFRRYMLLRLRRLYPMLFLGGLIGAGVFFAGLGEFKPTDRNDVILAIVSQFLLIPFLSSDGFYAFNRVQWSIALELLVNAVHAVALRWLSIPVLCGIVIVSAIALAISSGHCGTLNTICEPASMFYLLVLARAFFGFFVGVLLFRTQNRWHSTIPEISFFLLAIVTLALLSMPIPWASDGPGRAIYDFACVATIMPLVVMLAVRARAGDFALALGAMSYPLYAIHLPSMDAVRNGGIQEEAAIFAIAGLIAVAWAIGRYIDEPLNRWRRGASPGAPLRAAPASLSRSAPDPQGHRNAQTG